MYEVLASSLYGAKEYFCIICIILFRNDIYYTNYMRRGVGGAVIEGGCNQAFPMAFKNNFLFAWASAPWSWL